MLDLTSEKSGADPLTLMALEDIDLVILKDRLPIEPAIKQYPELDGHAFGLNLDDSRAMHRADCHRDQGVIGSTGEVGRILERRSGTTQDRPDQRHDLILGLPLGRLDLCSRRPELSRLPGMVRPFFLHIVTHERRGSRGVGGRFGQGVEEGVGGGLGGVDAVGDSDAVVGDPGQVEPGMAGQLAADGRDAVEVAEDVLGHRPGMPADPEEERVAGCADQLAQLAADQLADRRVVEVEKLGLGGAADEDAEQARSPPGHAWGT